MVYAVIEICITRKARNATYTADTGDDSFIRHIGDLRTQAILGSDHITHKATDVAGAGIDTAIDNKVIHGSAIRKGSKQTQVRLGTAHAEGDGLAIAVEGSAERMARAADRNADAGDVFHHLEVLAFEVLALFTVVNRCRKGDEVAKVLDQIRIGIRTVTIQGLEVRT
ncbi:MAG: hypothetical protein II812_03060, partial [Prevotella sp.]|nr:hypothetical protein [Prevotella sp.]